MTSFPLKKSRWLSNFNEEYVSGKFDKDDESRVHPIKWGSKRVKKTGKRKRVDIYKKERQDANNMRNRDVYSRSKSRGILSDLTEVSPKREGETANDVENKLITLIDLKTKLLKDES